MHDKAEIMATDLSEFTIIKEGEAEILMHAKNEVFFNKTQVPCLFFNDGFWSFGVKALSLTKLNGSFKKFPRFFFYFLRPWMLKVGEELTHDWY